MQLLFHQGKILNCSYDRKCQLQDLVYDNKTGESLQSIDLVLLLRHNPDPCSQKFCSDYNISFLHKIRLRMLAKKMEILLESQFKETPAKDTETSCLCCYEPTETELHYDLNVWLLKYVNAFGCKRSRT